MNIKAYMAELGSKARTASRHIAKATTAQKNAALLNIADSINQNREALLDANQQDMAAGKQKGLEAALLDRLECADDAACRIKDRRIQNQKAVIYHGGYRSRHDPASNQRTDTK